MFCITHQERKVLLFIGFLILIGSLLRIYQINTSRDAARKEPGTYRDLAERGGFSVNINKASPKEMEGVPGIGGVIARRIEEYRSQNGRFENLEDLKKVKGIGDKKADKIKSYITF